MHPSYATSLSRVIDPYATYFSNSWYNFHQFPHPNIGRPECFGGQFTISEQSKYFVFDNFSRFCPFRAFVVMKPINCFEKEGVSTPRQFQRVVAQWEGLSGAPVGGKGMPPFYILMPQTLAMEFRPHPGPGHGDERRCLGVPVSGLTNLCSTMDSLFEYMYVSARADTRVCVCVRARVCQVSRAFNNSKKMIKMRN